jgi:hypothetical protein
MATLNSPGVSVTVVDQSFYTPAAPGTVPLIIIATEQDKQNASGTGVAPGTLQANAGDVYLLTSQMDLGATFGIPYFQTDAENNPINASEINEYGLQAAYSFLGVSNQAYVVRADVDLDSLAGSATIPTGSPVDGAYWFDTATTSFGLFQYTAGNDPTNTNFTAQTVNVITNSAYVNTGVPIPAYGSVGSYAVVALGGSAPTNTLYYKNSTTWVAVGSTAWAASWPAATSAVTSTTTISSSDTLIINGFTVTGQTTVSGLVTAIATNITGVTAAVVNGYLALYSSGININISSGTLTTTSYGGGSGKTPLFTVGYYYAPALTISPHYTVPQYNSYSNTGTVAGYPTGSVWIKTTTVNQGANFDIEKYNATTGSWIRQSVSQLYANNQSAMAALDATGGGINIPVGQVYVKFNDTEGVTTQTLVPSGSATFPALANYKIYQRQTTGATVTTSNIVGASTFTSGSNTFTVTSSQKGSSTLPAAVTVTFTATAATTDANAFAAAFNTYTAGLGNVVASVNSSNQIVIQHTQGGDVRFVDGTSTPLGKVFSVTTSANWDPDPTSTGSDGKYILTAWAAVSSSNIALVTPSVTAPSTTPANGQLWYDTVIDADILVNTGSYWVGYLTTAGKAVVNPGVGFAVGTTSTDPNGPIISATQPTIRSDGLGLNHGDLWINTSNLSTLPQISRYNFQSKKWVAIDTTDHTTSNGIIFADARWSDQSTLASVQTGLGTPDTVVSLLSSSFVDFDAPDPTIYPKGTLLYNLRRSGFNIKKYVTGYVTTTAYNNRVSGTPLMTNYYPDRWVSVAANDYLGRGQFGANAQRAVVVQALNATIQSNQEVRDQDSKVFNLISCPGYIETLPALVGLNTDRGLLSFIVADAPAHLTPDATSLSNWGSNVNKATGDGPQGLVTTDPNTAVYYPWGYTTDLTGNNIVVPPSHIMLRTIALSDNVAYPWFAPAGVRRGGVTNASSVGYVDSQTGEFYPVALNNGQRDALSTIHVNPITYIGGVGLVAYGQKTRQLVASSLDRINVARLVIYLRYQLNTIAKPFIFEPNDTITRNEIKQQIEKLLLNLTAERALYDFLVVCDTTNNTPSRIDANELYVDIAIEPVKAVEFIYIPLRLENTGAIAGLSQQ